MESHVLDRRGHRVRPRQQDLWSKYNQLVLGWVRFLYLHSSRVLPVRRLHQPDHFFTARHHGNHLLLRVSVCGFVRAIDLVDTPIKPDSSRQRDPLVAPSGALLHFIRHLRINIPLRASFGIDVLYECCLPWLPPDSCPWVAESKQ